MRPLPRSSRGIRSKKFAGLKPRSVSVDRTNPRLEALEDRTLMACLDRPSLHLPDLSLGSFDLQPPSLPDLNVALRGINLGDINIGIDTYAIDLKAALGKIDVTLGNLPVIGAQLPNVTLPAIKMLDLMRVNLDVALEGLFGDINLPKIDVSAQLPSLLFDVFGPQGLNLLKDGPDAGNGISRSDVYTSHGSDWEQFDMHLGQSYYVDLPLDLGLSGADSPLAQYMPNFDLKLAANNGIRVQFQWDLYLGMGFTTHVGPEGTGFYFNSGARDNITGDALPELSASINVSAAPPKDAAGRDIPSNAPGLSASATMGLFQGSVTDGTAQPVQLTSRYPMYTNCPTNAYNANFNLIVSTRNEGTITVPVVFNDTNFVSFLADLNTKVNQGLAGKFPSANPLPISITPLFMAGKDPSSTIEATLRILSREPEITGLQIVGASDLGFVDDQYEDGRSQSLGFTDGATSVASGVNQVLTAALPAPSAGYLSEDADFKLLINGTIVPVVIREASTGKHIAGLAPSAGYFSDQTSLQEALLASLQNALSQSGFDPSKIQVSLDSSGRKFVITALPGLVPGQSAAPTLVAKVATVDKTQFSISTSVDLKSPSYDASKPGSLDRLYFTQLAQAKKNKTLSQIVKPQVRADGAIRLHAALGFAGQDLGIAGGSLSGPSVAFDLVWDVSATASYDLGTRTGTKTSQIGNVYFNNVQLDAGGVIQGILKPVAGVLGTITGPLSKVAGAGSAVLNKQIPFVSDLFGSTTLLSMLQSLSGADLSSLNTLFGFFDGLGSFPSAVASIPTDKPIGLGDWEFVTDKQNPLVGKLVPSEIGAMVDSGKSLPLSTFMTLLPQKPGFHLDLLDPTNIANLLMGNSFKIMSYGMPSAFNLNISPGFSASGSVDLGIGTVSYSVGAHLGIGVNFQPLQLVYDSKGLEEAVAQARSGQIPNPTTLLDGVYLTVPAGNAISVSGSFSASGSISAVDSFGDNVGSVSISAGLGMGAYLQIFDPIGHDDQLRLNEIFAATNNFSDPAGIFSLFNIGANLSGYLNFSGSILGISIDDVLDAIGIPTSYSISAGLSTNDIFGTTRSPAPQPLQLATPTTRNGLQVLEINAGPLASRRKSGNLDDSKGFHLKVTGNSSSITVINSDLNQQTTYTGNFSKVLIQGGAGADDIDCSGLTGVSAEIHGGGGNDVIRGGSGNDVIETGDGNVTVLGGAGNDVITGGAGTDTIVLGNGNNSVTAGTGRLVLTDGNGDNTIDASASLFPFVFTTGSGSDRIIGSNNNDTIVATGSGNVFIQTGAGNSTITGNAGADTILLGDGDNTVISGSGNQTIACGRGDNTIRLGGGNNSVTAGGGTMKITDGTGKNKIDFRGNAEAITADNFVATGSDTVYGTNFGDTVTTSGTGRITFYGGAGNDVITGGSGDDTIYLGPGTNRVDTGAGRNTVIENRGNNYIDFSKNDFDVTFSTAGGNDTVIGASLHDNFLTATGFGRTTLVGGKARNTLKGNAGNDTFIGKFGDTILEGSGVNTFVIDGTAGVGLTIGATQAIQGTNSFNFRPGETVTVTLGDQDESIDINGFNGKLSVSAGNGRNTLSARNLTGTTTITAGTGNDQITVHGVAGSLTLNPGTGANTLNISNISGTLSFNETGSDNVTINNTQGTLAYVGTGSNVVNATNIRGTKSFTTGAAADSITITNDPGTLTLNVGDGNDVVSLTGIAGTVSITGGAGNKTIGETNIVGDSTINLGNGSSSVTLTNVNGNISTTTGVGATSVSLTNTSGSKVTISTSSGDDTISLTKVASGQVTINDSGSSSSVGNRVTIGTSTAPVSITTGTGKNAVGVNGLTGTLGITAGDGDLGVTGSGISGHVRIDANNTSQGLGNDSFVLSQLADGLEIRSGVGTNSTTLSDIAGGLTLTTRTGNGLADTVSITNLSGGAAITTGSGPDSISLNGISGTLSVDTGLGGNVAPPAGQTLAVGDTITASGIASQATFTVRATAGVSPIVNGITLSDSSGSVTINGFENNGDVTSATLNRNSGNVTLALNSGNDMLTVNGGIGSVTYSSGDGDNSIAINSLAGPGSITLGGGRNVVRTFGNAGSLTVKGGRLSPTSPFDTSLIVDRSSVAVSLVGAIGTSVVGGTTLPTVTGLGLGAVSYQNVKLVEIDLGFSPDQFTFNDSGSTIPIVLNEGGGDDQTTVNALSSTTTVNGGSGNDTVIAEIPGDPSLSSFSRLQLNVDNLIVDNSSYASPVNWVYTTPNLIVGSTTIVNTTGASNVNLLGGTAGGNKLTINSLANSAQQLNIARSNIRLLAGANVLSPNASTPFVPGYQYGGGLGAVESLGTGSAGQQLELLATAQKPSISQIGPVMISSGFTDANLLIIGGNFRPTSQVVLSANNVSTTLAFTYLSNGLLNATVPASLRATGGTYSVSVINPGGTSSNTQTLTIDAPFFFGSGLGTSNNVLAQGTVDPHWTISGLGYSKAYAGRFGAWTATAPNANWITPNADPGAVVPVGSMTFTTTFDLTGYDPSTASLTGQVAVDNSITDIQLNGTSLGLAPINNANPSYTATVPFSIGAGFIQGVNTLSITIRNDGSQAGLLAALTGAAQRTTRTIPGSGFLNATVPAFGSQTYSSISSVITDQAAADLNGDGFADLAYVAAGSSLAGSNAGLGVLLGDGVGGFTETFFSISAVSVGPPQSVAVADLNGDGKLDLFVLGTKGYQVYKGNGDGTFTALSATSTSTSSQLSQSRVILADFTGDGKLDAAISSNSSFGLDASLIILAGKGDGTFQRAVFNSLGSTNNSGFAKIFTLDLNGDGKKDVLGFNQSGVKWLANLGNGDFDSPVALPLGSAINGLSVTDFDGDGLADIATLSGGTVSIYRGTGLAGFQLTSTVTTGAGTSFLGVGDLNGDGLPDLFCDDPSSTSVVRTITNQGSARFILGPTISNLAGGFSRVIAADLDGNQSPDLVAIDNLNEVSTVLNQFGFEGTIAAVTPPAPSASRSVLGVSRSTNLSILTTADVNSDGFDDLISIASNAPQFQVSLGNGNGTFGTPTTYSITSGPTSIKAADVNGDGKPDLLLTRSTGIGVLLNNGSGGFGAETTITASTSGFKLVVGDVTGDGILDLVEVKVTGTQIFIHPGLGNGTFSSTVTTLTMPTYVVSGTTKTATIQDAVVADLNRDGRPDLAVMANAGLVVEMALFAGSTGGVATTSAVYALTSRCRAWIRSRSGISTATPSPTSCSRTWGRIPRPSPPSSIPSRPRRRIGASSMSPT